MQAANYPLFCSLKASFKRFPAVALGKKTDVLAARLPDHTLIRINKERTHPVRPFPMNRCSVSDAGQQGLHAVIGRWRNAVAQHCAVRVHMPG